MKIKLSKYQRSVLAAFDKEMQGKCYGEDETNQARYFFCAGWAACCDMEANELRAAWSELTIEKARK